MPLHPWNQVFSMLSGVDLYKDTQPAYGMNGTYGAFMYNAHAMDGIDNFKQSGAPAMFMYMPFQNTHAP